MRRRFFCEGVKMESKVDELVESKKRKSIQQQLQGYCICYFCRHEPENTDATERAVICHVWGWLTLDAAHKGWSKTRLAFPPLVHSLHLPHSHTH
jgi:hypothetical protein